MLNKTYANRLKKTHPYISCTSWRSYRFTLNFDSIPIIVTLASAVIELLSWFWYILLNITNSVQPDYGNFIFLISALYCQMSTNI